MYPAKLVSLVGVETLLPPPPPDGARSWMEGVRAPLAPREPSLITGSPAVVFAGTAAVKVAMTWAEMWYTGLEEASRLYFAETNIRDMLKKLQVRVSRSGGGVHDFLPPQSCFRSVAVSSWLPRVMRLGWSCVWTRASYDRFASGAACPMAMTVCWEYAPCAG